MSLDVSLRIAIFWVAAILCVIAELAILRSMFRGSRPGAEPPGDSTVGAVPRGQPAMELVWAIVPALALVLVLVLTREAIR